MDSPLVALATSDLHPVRRNTAQLLTFFVLAFVIAWAAWVPLFTIRSLPSQISFIGMFAPSIAAVCTAAIFDGAHSVKQIFRRLLIVRFPLRWYLLSAFLTPAVYLAAISGVRILGFRETGPLLLGSGPIFLLTAFVWMCFVSSGEEIGWRAFALPLLLERTDHVVLTSLSFGLIWGVWHLPVYLAPGGGACPIPLFLLLTSLLSVLYTVIFLQTKGSLLPALLLHAGTDIAPRVFQLGRLPARFWVLADVALAVTVAAFVIGMRQQLRNAGRSYRALKTVRRVELG